MAEVTNRQVNIYIATGDAEKALDVLKKKERELKDALSQATDPRVVQKLEAELKKLAQPIENATNKLTGKLSPSLKDLTKTVSALDRELKTLSKEDPNFTRKLRQFQQAKIELSQAKLEADKLSGALQKSASGSGFVGKLQSGASSFLGGFGIGAGIAGADAIGSAISDFFKNSIGEALEAERTVNNFRQALEAAGRSDAFDRLSESADKFAKSFSFLDNDEVIGAFSQLVSYGKLTEQQMNRLIPVIIDLYSKQQLAGNSAFTLAESTSVVIKALEGNGKALKEYGINIKDGGDLTERFNIVVDDLAQKVSGAGDAFKNDFTGQIQAAQQEIKNLQEELGNELLPVWEKVKIGFLSGIKGIIDGFRDAKNIVSELFLSTDELQNQERRKQAASIDEQIKKTAESFAEFYSKDSIEKQKEILANQQRILDSQKKQLENRQLIDQAMGLGFTKEAIALNKDVRESEAIVAKLQEQIQVQSSKQTFGGRANDGGPIANTADDLERLNEQLKEIERQLGLKSLTEFQRKLAEINDKFDKLVANAKKLGSQGLVDKANKLRQQEIDAAVEDFEQQMAKKLRSKVAIPVIVDVIISPESKNKFTKEVQALATGRTPGQAVNYQPKKKEENTVSETIQEYIDYAQSAITIYGSISDALARINERELEDERAKIEKKKALYQQQLESNLISRKEYDRKVIGLDAALAKKEKDIRKQKFRRDQIESGVRAAMNIAEAVTKMLTAGPLAGQILAGVAAAAGVVQLGIIASSKFPEYGRGGKLTGPRHTEGGMPVINPRTGQKEAEVEGGEYILSRKTVENNRRIADALLESSMYRDGATIGGYYERGGRLPGINYSRASNSLQRVTRYERGGSFASAASNSADMENSIANLNIMLASLQNRLDQGIVAYASIQQFNTTQKRLDDIIADVTMK